MCQGEATGWLKGFGRINRVPRGGQGNRPYSNSQWAPGATVGLSHSAQAWEAALWADKNEIQGIQSLRPESSQVMASSSTCQDPCVAVWRPTPWGLHWVWYPEQNTTAYRARAGQMAQQKSDYLSLIPGGEKWPPLLYSCLLTYICVLWQIHADIDIHIIYMHAHGNIRLKYFKV